jgi:hypothetical protein
MFKICILILAITVGVLASAMLRPRSRPPEAAKSSVLPEITIAPKKSIPQPEIATAKDSRLPLPTQTAEPVLDRASLTRALQRELKRVGCYRGDINGVWTDATRQAMTAFTERANARLPVSEPHQVLLVLVQNTQAKSCDWVASASVPVSAKKEASHVAPVGTDVPPMALAGPKPSDRDAVSPPARKLHRARNRGSAEERFRGSVAEPWTVSIWRKFPN